MHFTQSLQRNCAEIKIKKLSLENFYRHKVRKKPAAVTTWQTKTTQIKHLVDVTLTSQCNYNTYNGINKLLPSATILLITAILINAICHIDAATSVAPISPLTALFQSGGASAIQSFSNNNSVRQQQLQLFALLTKNGQAKSDAQSLGNKQQVNDEGDSLRLPNPMFETSGFVSDEGDQYEKAELALAAAAANTMQKSNKSNNQLYSNDCPKECTCLNDYFECGKKLLEHVPTLPDYVQVLDFVGNKLNDKTVLEIRNLTELHKLNLKKNEIENLPKFQGLTALKQLNLANNRIQQLSREALAALPKLKSLDLSKNNLHVIGQDNFPQANRLTHLILNYNKIKNIDENAFAHLRDLVDLEMNNNRLSILPAGVFQNLTKLKKLSLNNNYLEINWSTFRGLQSLQKLYLKLNNIRALQDGVFHVMRSIETIELDHNAITSLSRQGLFNLTKLHHLSLSNNSISRIEVDTFDFTQSLISLDLSHNNISEFKPQHLECLQHLQRLNLGYNKIQYLMENTFDCVKSLEDLNLRRNKLAWVIEDQGAAPPFKALQKLKKLDLNGNNLKQITTKSFSGLNNLESLNLGGNALASVQSNAFEHMTHLQKFIFKSINFICDCELLWFRRWLQNNFNKSQHMLKNAVCGYPEHLLDRELGTLTKAELICADTPKPKIIQEPSNQLAVKGANITLECLASSPAAASLAAADELKIIWRHDNQNLRSRYPGSSVITGATHGIHSYSNTETQIHHDASKNLTNIIGHIRLYNVSYENAGKYQCVVSNAFGTTYSQKFKISIGIHPIFLQTPSNLTIDSGDSARLVCSATGDPTPEIALQKFGDSDFPAATERRLQVIREENAFVITNAKPIDTGIYTCTAESAAGELKINATLIVNDKPQPKIPNVRKESVLGQVTALECLNEVAIELSDPHREWYKDNKPFHASTTSASKRYYFTNEREYLIIRDTQSGDAGQYRCEITDNSKTYTLLSELVVVKEDFNQNVIIIGVVLVTISCILVGSLIIWIILCFQKRKMTLNARAEEMEIRASECVQNGSHQQMINGSLERTQLTTLNRTILRQTRYSAQRPRSLADLDFRTLNDSVRVPNSLLVNGSSNYRNHIGAGITLEYLQNTSTQDIDQQQDQLSSKDSGTGSDAATKRSIDDFTLTLIPKASSSVRDINDMKSNREHFVNIKHEHNELQYGSNQALGISEYDMELCDLNPDDENVRFLRHHKVMPTSTSSAGNANSAATPNNVCKDNSSTNIIAKHTEHAVDI